MMKRIFSADFKILLDRKDIVNCLIPHVPCPLELLEIINNSHMCQCFCFPLNTCIFVYLNATSGSRRMPDSQVETGSARMLMSLRATPQLTKGEVP